MTLSRRRVDWADVACLGGLTAGCLYYLAIIPLFPSLIGTHPVLLEALSGSMPSQIAAGAFARVGRAPLILALTAPVTGMMAFDPFWWWAGRRYGDRLTQVMAVRSPRSARSVDRSMRLFHRCGGWTIVLAYYLPVPNNILYAAAGWAGLSLLRFVVLDLIGTMLWAVMNVGLGYALGGRAVAVAGLISRYSIAATVALIAGLILVAWWRDRRGAAAAPVTVAAGREPNGAATAPVGAAAGLKPGGAAATPTAVEACWEPGGAAAAQVAAHLRPLVADGTVPGLVYAVVTPGGQATGHLSRTGSQPLGPHVLLETGGDQGLHRAPACRYGRTGRGPARRPDRAPSAPGCGAGVSRGDPDHAAPAGDAHLWAAPAPPQLLSAGVAPSRGPVRQVLHRASVPRAAPGQQPGPGTLSLLQLWLWPARPPAQPHRGTLLCRSARRAGHRAARPRRDLRWRTGRSPRRGRAPARPAHRPLAPGRAGRRGRAQLHRGRPGPLPQRQPSPGGDPGPLGDRGHPAPGQQPQTGLGWHICSPAGRPVLWHNGGTGGFGAMLALDRDAGCAVGAVAASAPTRHHPLDTAVLTALTELIQAAPVSGS